MKRGAPKPEAGPQTTPLFKQFFWIFAVVCVALGYLGSRPAEGIYVVLSQILTVYYFSHFLIILPLLGLLENPKPLPASISDAVLARILTAAHFAPSVGYMQPWSFLLIREAAVKQRIHAAFAEANAEAAAMFEGKKQEIYRELKLEGILESPVNLLITCDRDRAGPVFADLKRAVLAELGEQAH